MARWIVEWLKRASPEEIEAFRVKSRERSRLWRLANPEKEKARAQRISPKKLKEREEKRVLREQARVIARALRLKKRRAMSRAWHVANRDRENERRLEHYRENREAHLARCKVWQDANREQYAAYKREWYKANAEKLINQAKARSPATNARLRERRATEPQFAITSRLRVRMRKALIAQGAVRSKAAAALIGCTPAEFRAHIEAQFVDGMTWDNRSDWHMDHKLPCAAFDLTDPAQQVVCFHYSNIRPVWGPENLRKGAKVLPEFLAA